MSRSWLHVLRFFICLDCKKGRYTYEKRLNNLKEMFLAQSESISSSSATSESASSVVIPAASTSPATISMSEIVVPLPATKNADSELLQFGEHVKQAYITSFPDRCKFTETFSTQDERIKNHLRDRGWSEVRTYAFIPGPQSDQAPTKDFSGVSSVSEHIPSLRLPKEQQHLYSEIARQKLWFNIAKVLETSVTSLSRFVKQLPGFNDLLMEDRLILFKSVLVEQFSLTSANVYQYEINAQVFFDDKTEDLHLFPIDVLAIVFADAEYHTANAR